MKKFPLLLVLILFPISSFASDLITMVRDPTTYEWTLDVLNNPVTRTTIAGAAAALPEAAAAVGVTVSSGVTLPLAAAVLGAAWISDEVYKRQNLKRDFYNPPLYAEMTTIPSAQDFICQPAHITYPVSTVTPSSFPNATEQLIGRPCFVSTPVGEFLDSVNSSSDSSVQALKDIVTANTSSGSVDPSSLPSDVIFSAYGINFRLDSGINNGGAYTISGFNSAMSGMQKPDGINGYVWHNASWTIYMLMFLGPYNSSTGYYTGYFIDLKQTTNPVNFVPQPSGINYQTLKTALKEYFLTNPDSVSETLAKTTPKNLAITDKVPSPSDPRPWTQTGPISQQELNNWYTTNNQNVSNYNTTNITNNSTVQEIAKGAAASASSSASVKIPDTIVFTGGADLPPNNSYNSNVDQPIENNFVDRVYQFINSGLPVLSLIRSSTLTASGSPRMSTIIWGHTIEVDFSDQQTVLRAAGSVLVIISLITAYLIVVRS